MKFANQLIISTFLLQCNTSIEAFGVQNRQVAYMTGNTNTPSLHPRYASTLDDTDIKASKEDDDNHAKTATSSTSSISPNKEFAVSANHIVSWDEEKKELRIKECSDMMNGVKDGYKKEIVYEEKIHDHHDGGGNKSDTQQQLSMSSSSSSLSSSSSSMNGIKMVTNEQIRTNISSSSSLLSSSTTQTITSNEMETAPQGPSLQETVNKVESAGKSNSNNNSGKSTFSERITNSGVASAAAMATAAVNAAVSMKTLEAPSTTKSYISLDTSKPVIDEDGLPLRYDKDAIESYWKKERGALNQRWGYFVGKAVPFLTRLTTLFIKDGKIEERYIPELSEQARIDLQDLGPTFIKAGQMMSVRPDVLPQVRHFVFVWCIECLDHSILLKYFYFMNDLHIQCIAGNVG